LLSPPTHHPAGKQLVYHSLQAPPSDNESPSDLAALETQATTLRNDIAAAKAAEKSLKSELTLLSSVTSAEDLKSTVEALLTQKASLQERLLELKKVEVTPVSESEKIKMEAEQAKWSRWRNQRRGVLKELWLCYKDLRMNASLEKIEEGELWEELGCEGAVPR
jgi:hypothetical protein